MTQPTHDKVIAWIDREVIEAGWYADSSVDSYFIHHQSDIDEANRYRASLLANRAGLERHKPEIRYLLDECGGSFDSEQEAIDSCDRLGDDPLPVVTTFVICAYCGGLNAEIMEDADEWVYDPSVYFPCSSYTDISNPIVKVM